jgi:hypothetical protein
LASTASVPTSLAVEPQSYGRNPNPTADIGKNSSLGGGCQTDALTSVRGHNTSCTVAYTYKLVGVSAGGGWSAPTAAVSIGSGPATLSSSNNLNLTWSGGSNDIAYLVYSCVGTSCVPTLHAVIPHMGAPGAVAQSYRDFGHAFGSEMTFGTAMQSGSVREDLFAIITGISGNSVTLSSPPSANGNVTMRHDDSVPIQAAIDSLCAHTAASSTGGTVYFPTNGNFQIAQTLSLYGCYGMTLVGAGENGDGGRPVNLAWVGGIGGTLINMNKTADVRVADLSHAGLGGNTAGVLIDVDNYATGGTGDNVPTQHDIFAHLELGNAAIPVRISNRGGANVQNNTFEDVQVSNPSSNQGGVCGYYFGGLGQSYNNEMRGGLIQGYDLGIRSNFVGQLEVYGTNFENNIVDLWFSNRFGGAADGNILFKGITSEGAFYTVYNEGGGVVSPVIIEESRMADTPGPNGFLMNVNAPLMIENSYVGSAAVAGIANNNMSISRGNLYSDSSIPYRSGGGSNVEDSLQFVMISDYYKGNVGPLIQVGHLNHSATIEACSDNGVATASLTLSFAVNSCQKVSTAISGLTYTLSIVGVLTDQVVTIESYLTGAVATGPLWTSSSGTIKWAGGTAPVSSIAAGFIDVIRLKWDGANWIEISRSIGNH